MESSQKLYKLKQQHSALLDALDPQRLSQLKQQALEKARLYRDKVVRDAHQGMDQARMIAQDLASSKSAQEVSTKAGAALKQIEQGPCMRIVARIFISLFFINHAYTEYERWGKLSRHDMVYPQDQGRHHLIEFPFVDMGILLPCALLACVGYAEVYATTMLLLDIVWDGSILISTQLTDLFIYGQRPSELTVKRVAIIGCIVLLFSHAAKKNKKLHPYTGLILNDLSRKPEVPVHTSLGLLVGRLLLTSLFIYIGLVQMERVIKRDYRLFLQPSQPGSYPSDGHDNNWLLLEFLLSLPFAVGYRTPLVSLLLALTLSLEAVTCWPFWAGWQNWTIVSHVRLHFFTNLAVAGGLLLLQGYGAGRYTVDAFIEKKKE